MFSVVRKEENNFKDISKMWTTAVLHLSVCVGIYLDATNWEARNILLQKPSSTQQIAWELSVCKKWKDSHHSSKTALRIRFVESGSVMRIRIRDPMLFLIPGSGMGKNPDPGSGILDEHTGSYFWKRHQFFGLEILKFFYADPDPGYCHPWIRDG